MPDHRKIGPPHHLALAARVKELNQRRIPVLRRVSATTNVEILVLPGQRHQFLHPRPAGVRGNDAQFGEIQRDIVEMDRAAVLRWHALGGMPALDHDRDVQFHALGIERVQVPVVQRHTEPVGMHVSGLEPEFPDGELELAHRRHALRDVDAEHPADATRTSLHQRIDLADFDRQQRRPFSVAPHLETRHKGLADAVLVEHAHESLRFIPLQPLVHAPPLDDGTELIILHVHAVETLRREDIGPVVDRVIVVCHGRELVRCYLSTVSLSPSASMPSMKAVKPAVSETRDSASITSLSLAP